MFKAIHTAATGMAAQEKNVNVIANNIANVNTTGFKQGRAEFEDLLYQTLRAPGARSSVNTKYNVGIQIGSGSKVSAVRKINSQGNPIVTNNAFDLMINGNGYFGIIGENNNIVYTRDGSYHVNDSGEMVTREGYVVFPGIVVPQETTNVNITRSGDVEAFLPNQVEPQIVGNIPVFTFPNPAGLSNIGRNYLDQTTSSGPPLQGIGGQNNAGVIEQGKLEASNVSIMNEMTNMIKAQRAYEMNSKVMNMADQMLNTVNSIR